MSTEAPATTQESLVVQRLRREYPAPDQPLVVLRDINFKLGRGESMSIMGPSGSGKSTLLHIVGTLDTPTAGEVLIGGRNPFQVSARERSEFRGREIGFVFQDHHLLPQCDVLENVLIPTFVREGDGKELEARARDLLQRVGLSQRLTHRPGELSGGERQRVAIARALIYKPTLLLCDEPTGNLDARNADVVGEILKGIQAERATAIVVVTHSPAFADLFDHKYRMNDGMLEGA